MKLTRRRRSSRILVIALGLAVSAGIYAAFRPGDPQPLGVQIEETRGLPAAEEAPAPGPLRPLLVRSETPEVAAPNVTPPAPVVVVTPAPATRPSAPPEVEAVKPQPARSTPASTGNGLADARLRFEAGDLMAARNLLNDALNGGKLPAAETASARELMGKISEVAVFSPKAFKEDTITFTYTVMPGDTLVKLAAQNNVTAELLARINRISDPRKMRAGQTIKVVRGPFHAVVNKGRFTIDLYLGSPGGPSATFVAGYPVGLGANDSTPTGTWQVASKLPNPQYYSPRGEGIIPADDPRNPLGEHWIGLRGIDGVAVGKASYGLHGTIDPDSIGKEESMGCIRLRNEDIAVVYQMLVAEKSVVVVRE